MAYKPGPDIKQKIKEKALALGFDAFGVARARPLSDYAPRLNAWLERGGHAGMEYMQRNIAMRLNPDLLMEGTRSVVVVAMNYHPQAVQNPECKYRVATYAYGKDYHYVIKEKLHLLLSHMMELVPGTSGRCFTDSAPVMERAWAVEAGLGWTGKNACLILPQKGSYFFLGEILTNLELEPDNPFRKSHCGNCRLCVDACPGGAIRGDGSIDSARCLSYLTIEEKKPLDSRQKALLSGWVFGCDVCQMVCPHNRFATPTREDAFRILEPLGSWDTHQWQNMDKTGFKKAFIRSGSPLARVRYEKLKDNMDQ